MCLMSPERCLASAGTVYGVGPVDWRNGCCTARFCFRVIIMFKYIPVRRSLLTVDDGGLSPTRRLEVAVLRPSYRKVCAVLKVRRCHAMASLLGSAAIASTLYRRCTSSGQPERLRFRINSAVTMARALPARRPAR